MRAARWPSFGASAAASVALLTVASQVSADAAPIPGPGQYGSVGVNVGVSGHQVKSNGFVFGAEASLPYFFDGASWLGLYGDVLRDFGDSSTRFSVGPEIGWGPFGFDGGLLVRSAETATRLGWQMRGMLTLAVVALYVGYGDVPSDPVDHSITQFGMLLKIPFPIWEAPNRRHHGPPSPPEGGWQAPVQAPSAASPPPPAPSGSSSSGPWAEPPP